MNNEFRKRIEIQLENGIKVDVKLRGVITIIVGDSGVGKTYLSEILKGEASDVVSPNKELEGALVINQNSSIGPVVSEMVDRIINSKGKLIVLDDIQNEIDTADRAGLGLSEHIEKDIESTYVIMTRKQRWVNTLGATVSNIAEIKVSNKKLELAYLEDGLGW